MIPDNEIKDAFENLARLKGSKIKNVDSIMLHAYLALYMCAGLKKKEISEAKIKDVKFNNNGRISGIVTNSQGGNGNFVPFDRFPCPSAGGIFGLFEVEWEPQSIAKFSVVSGLRRGQRPRDK